MAASGDLQDSLLVGMFQTMPAHSMTAALFMTELTPITSFTLLLRYDRIYSSTCLMLRVTSEGLHVQL